MNFELNVVVKTTIVLLSAGIAVMALKRASASTRHAIWTTALLCSLVLPAADALLPQAARVEFAVLPAEKGEPAVDFQAVPPNASSARGYLGESRVQPVQAAATSWSISQWIVGAWAVGFMVSLAGLAIGTLSAYRLARQSVRTTDKSWTGLMTRLQGELIVAPPELRIGGDTPPMTWGVFRHAILLPSAANSWTEEQRRAVLAHELAHVKRHDGLIQLLVQIVCSVYWFNPVVWFAERRMRLERERACDDYALNLGARPGAYADQLLELASGGAFSLSRASVAIAHPSQLESRLLAILNPKIKRANLSRRSAATILSLLIAVMFCVTAIRLTTLLALSIPALGMPSTPSMPSEPSLQIARQEAAISPQNVGSVSGRVVWSDGAVSAGALVSAIATTTEGLDPTWVLGTEVAGSAVTDNSGRYRIENLPAGVYHIVTGPVFLPRNFSDVTESEAPYLVTVTPGKAIEEMNFTGVRNSAGVLYDPNTVLTLTGRIEWKPPGGGGIQILVMNFDGTYTRWGFRNRYPGRDRFNPRNLFWWPGYSVSAGPNGLIRQMSNAGEVVTISGTD